MSRGPYPFKKSDITRALNAAKKAGVDVKIEVVNTDGRVLRIIPIKPDDAASTEDLKALL